MADELTPEEKLLKVIQQGGKPVPMTPMPVPPAPTLEATSSSSSSPSSAAPAATRCMPVSRGTAALGISLLRRVLISVTVALLALVAFELYHNLPEPVAAPAAINRPLVAMDLSEAATPIGEATAQYDARRIFGIAGEEPGPVRTSLTVVAWIGQVHEKYKFMAISEVDASGSTGSEPVVEAIVLDKFTKTIQFLREGQIVRFGGTEVVVKAITENAIEFESGSDSMRLSAGSPPR
jgi:hypothetical protein